MNPDLVKSAVYLFMALLMAVGLRFASQPERTGLQVCSTIFFGLFTAHAVAGIFANIFP